MQGRDTGYATRLVASTAGAVLLLGTLGGCAFFRTSDGDPLPGPSRSPSASRTPTPTADADAPLSDAELQDASATPRAPTPAPTEVPGPAPTISALAPGTVVAEGDVTSPKGSIRFHFRMVAASADTFSAEYTGFTSSLPVPVSVGLFEVARSVGDGLTYPGLGEHVLGGPTGAPGSSVTVPLDAAGADPSGLVHLVVSSSAAAGQDVPVEIADGKVLAVAPVHWSVPERTTNVLPVDGGARADATGRVSETTPAGTPRSYVVAPEDLIGDVAARFGISVADLIWLNPGTRVFGDQQYLYEGTTLNLDPFRR